MINKMKKCSKCGQTKDKIEFNDNKTRKDGKDHVCRACKKVITREYRDRLGTKLKDSSKDWFDEQHLTWAGKARLLHYDMQRNSNTKGFPAPSWTVSEIEDAISDSECAISGVPFRLGKVTKQNNLWAPSPDRIDNTKGYTKDNVQWVLWGINSIKKAQPNDIINEFISSIKGAKINERNNTDKD